MRFSTTPSGPTSMLVQGTSAQPSDVIIAPPQIDYASPAIRSVAPRLISLDAFRGLVILAMLIVNNVGDPGSTGYFWKHAEWPPMTWRDAWPVWWENIRHPTDSAKFRSIRITYRDEWQ